MGRRDLAMGPGPFTRVPRMMSRVFRCALTQERITDAPRAGGGRGGAGTTLLGPPLTGRSHEGFARRQGEHSPKYRRAGDRAYDAAEDSRSRASTSSPRGHWVGTGPLRRARRSLHSGGADAGVEGPRPHRGRVTGKGGHRGPDRRTGEDPPWATVRSHLATRGLPGGPEWAIGSPSPRTLRAKSWRDGGSVRWGRSGLEPVFKPIRLLTLKPRSLHRIMESRNGTWVGERICKREG